MSGFQGNLRVGYSKCNHLNEAGEQRHDWKSRKLCQRLQAEAQRKVQAGKKRQKKVFVSGELGHAYWHKIVPTGRWPDVPEKRQEQICRLVLNR